MGPLPSFVGMALVSYYLGKQKITNQGLGLVPESVAKGSF